MKAGDCKHFTGYQNKICNAGNASDGHLLHSYFDPNCVLGSKLPLYEELERRGYDKTTL